MVKVTYCPPGPADPSLYYRRYTPIALMGAKQRGRRGNDDLELEDLIVNHGATVRNVVFENHSRAATRHGEVETVDGD